MVATSAHACCGETIAIVIQFTLLIQIDSDSFFFAQFDDYRKVSSNAFNISLLALKKVFKIHDII